MFRRTIAALVGVMVVGSTVSAQAPARLRWQTGQVLLYKVEQATVVTEVIGENKEETRIKVGSTKRWQVLDVDAGGVATVQHSLVALRQETVTTDGKTMLFDSANPDKSTPGMKEAFTKFVGAPLAVLRVDGLGRVLEVKQSSFGPAERYESELPFAGVLPAEGLKPGQVWERSYHLTVAWSPDGKTVPAQGSGDKFPAVQHYTCKNVTGTGAVVSVTTELKGLPEAIVDRVPLLQMQPEGEIVYDLSAGRYQGATLKVDKELKGFQGENSSIHFVSSYVEQYVGDR